MSIFGLWLDQLYYNARAKYHEKEFEKHLAKAIAEESEDQQESESENDSDSNGTVAAEVFDEKTQQFKKTEATDETPFIGDIFTGPTNAFQSAFNVPEMSKDDFFNFLDKKIKEIKPEKSDVNLYRNIITCVLFLTDRIGIDTVFAELNGKKQDASEIFNSVYKFFTGMILFPACNCLEISEVITLEKLLGIMKKLNEDQIFNTSYTFGLACKRTKEAYMEEQYKQKSDNGARDVSGEEIIEPILFNNSLLSNIDFETGNIPAPRLSIKMHEYLQKKFRSILNIKDGNNVDLIIDGKPSEAYANYGVDSGQAILTIRNTENGMIYKQLNLDLDTIAGTGINVIVNAYDEVNKYFHVAFINADANPEIIRKIVSCPGEFILGAENNFSNREEYETIMAQCLPIKYYAFFDFSKMHNVISKMNTDGKRKFMEQLDKVIHCIPWQNILGIGAMMPRFRFRDYTSPSEFVLVSDCDVRVQDHTWMVTPYMNPFGKLYINNGNIQTDNNIVVNVEDNKYDMFINGTEIKF